MNVSRAHSSSSSNSCVIASASVRISRVCSGVWFGTWWTLTCMSAMHPRHVAGLLVGRHVLRHPAVELVPLGAPTEVSVGHLVGEHRRRGDRRICYRHSLQGDPLSRGGTPP